MKKDFYKRKLAIVISLILALSLMTTGAVTSIALEGQTPADDQLSASQQIEAETIPEVSDSIVSEEASQESAINDSENVSPDNLASEEDIWAAAATNKVTLKFNGSAVSSSVPAQIINNRTMIPARALFEKAGAAVSWNGTKRTVTITYAGHTIVLTIDSKTAYVDGKAKTLDVAAQIVNGSTLIPVRFVSEALGFTVNWDGTNKVVSITGTVMRGHITGVKVSYATTTNKYTTVTITTDADLLATDLTFTSMSNPYRYVIDFRGFTPSSSCPKTLGSNPYTAANVTGIRVSQYKDTVWRFVADLSANVKPTVSYTNTRTMVLKFAEKDVPASTSTGTTGSTTGSTGSTTGNTGSTTGNTGSTEPEETETNVIFNPYADGKLVVALDPGHGSDTSGKRSPDGSLREYEFNKDVASRTKKILESKGIQCILTVSENSTKDVSLADRCSIANNSIADIFVSFHANAFGNGITWENSATGWEIYYYSPSTVGSRLASYIHNANFKGSNVIGIKDRGIKTANFYVIKNTRMPAVLIEHGFYTSSVEVELLKSSAFRQKCAELDAIGIINFLQSYK